MQVRGGRRPASTSISANVIAAAQLISENYHLRDIYRVTMDNDSAIEWLAQRGLISNTQSCCGQPMCDNNSGVICVLFILITIVSKVVDPMTGLSIISICSSSTFLLSLSIVPLRI